MSFGLFDVVAGPFVDFGFMRRALAGCLALSLGATPVGVFLLLRRMSLMGDAMSHAILPGAALGYLAFGLSLGAMTVGGILAGLLVALLQRPALQRATRADELRLDDGDVRQLLAHAVASASLCVMETGCKPPSAAQVATRLRDASPQVRTL